MSMSKPTYAAMEAEEKYNVTLFGMVLVVDGVVL